MFRLKNVRKSAGMSQQQLASMIGITQATLSGWENEKYEIDNGSLNKCAEISTLSPRFVETYNQCMRAESNGDLNIAAIGMRSALEILIKDYAIVELKEPKEAVTAKSLYQAISDYLKEDELIKPADVVRILGNDHTHYQRKYPEHDYKLLKSYMDIFISLIETKLKIHHPPVAR